MRKLKKNFKILAIESSCDDTSCAVVVDGRKVLSNIVSSQIDIHTRFGGVVPEIASRNHIMTIDNVVKSALETANVSLKDIDAIAVTYGAGLVGSLLVGVCFAKALSFATGLPLIPVNHIYGHIASNYITYPNLQPPFLCLLVSGGHTALIKVNDYTHHTLIGETLDDSVGESFDKVSKVLGLGYPGGPKISEHANNGQPNIEFGKLHDDLGFNFSFSGKKTAVINYIHKLEQKGLEIPTDDICASYQQWAVEDLVYKTILATKKYNFDKVVIAGGVSANKLLRSRLKEECDRINVQCLFPELKYCTDNAAMIGSAGYYNILMDKPYADFSLAPNPSLTLTEYEKDPN